LGQEWLV